MKKIKSYSIVVTLLSLAALPVNAADTHTQGPFPHFDMPVHEDPLFTKWMLDRLERRFTDGADQTYWEAQAWFGSDENKLWLKTEGDRFNGKTEDAELEVYYSHAVTAFWDAQIGVRHDAAINAAPSRNWLGIGWQGLAPYMVEIDATAYIGDNGRSAARFKAEYDLLLTQNWVIMPEIEVNAFGKADPERSLGSGLSNADLTLRIRYDIRRELSPYVGVMWTKKFGGTASFARADGAATSATVYVAGIRAWW